MGNIIAVAPDIGRIDTVVAGRREARDADIDVPAAVGGLDGTRGDGVSRAKDDASGEETAVRSRGGGVPPIAGTTSRICAKGKGGIDDERNPGIVVPDVKTNGPALHHIAAGNLALLAIAYLVGVGFEFTGNTGGGLYHQLSLADR